MKLRLGADAGNPQEALVFEPLERLGGYFWPAGPQRCCPATIRPLTSGRIIHATAACARWTRSRTCGVFHLLR